MAMIETDVLLACMNPQDRHHEEAVKLITSLAGKLMLSPFSLIELDMLIRSGRIQVLDYHEFASALSDLLSLYDIRVLPDGPDIHELAWTLRNVHGLSFFDSPHASTAMAKGLMLYSYDRAYGRVEGLRWKKPSDVI